jgi:hypothetical protein
MIPAERADAGHHGAPYCSPREARHRGHGFSIRRAPLPCPDLHGRPEYVLGGLEVELVSLWDLVEDTPSTVTS